MADNDMTPSVTTFSQQILALRHGARAVFFNKIAQRVPCAAEG